MKEIGYDYILKYSGRSPVVHLKDFTCKDFASGPVYALIDNTGKEKERPTHEYSAFMFKPLGSGMQDFPAILKACEAAGTDVVVVEQDRVSEGSPMENAGMSQEYLKNPGL